MENIISKMGLYDLFARGLTGVVVLCATDLFGIANILGSDVPVWVLILCGYFCGLVLEELSYLLECVLKFRKKAENKVCTKTKYQKYDYEKYKAALLANDKDIVMEEPLTHIIMSGSFQIAFVFFIIVEILDAVCCNDLISGNFICPDVDVGILTILILVFHGRALHYSRRRAEQIFDFCIAKNYAGIEKEEKSK